MADRRWYILFFCIALILPLFIISVTANPVPRTRSIQLYLERDGFPYTEENALFTIDCYGYFSALTNHHEFLRNRTENDPNPPEKIFSLAGNCSVYGCIKSISTQSPPDTYWEPESSKFCRITVTTAGKSFTIWNRSDIQGIACFHRSDQWDTEKKIGRNTFYYNFTPEYFSCKKRVEAIGKECQEFLLNGKQGKINNSGIHNQCIELYNHQSSVCDNSLQQINVANINPAEYYCQFRFDVPPDLQRYGDKDSSNRLREVTQSPIESLFCSILQHLGGKCE